MTTTFSRRAVAGLAGTLLAATLLPLNGALATNPAPAAPAAQTARQDEGIDPACSGCGYGVSATEISRTRVDGKHVRDLSTSWAPASKYTWGETETVSATISADVGVDAHGAAGQLGVTGSTSRAFSVQTEIPANSDRSSKLALKADYYKIYTRFDRKAQGITVSTEYGYVYAPIDGTPEIYVRYK